MRMITSPQHTHLFRVFRDFRGLTVVFRIKRVGSIQRRDET